MTVVYLDIELARIRSDPTRAPRHAAKIERGRARLAAAAGEPCVVMPAEGISWQQLVPLQPTAIVLSGSTADWVEYDLASLAGLFEIIRAAPLPILGICGGHQLIGYAHGASWGPLGPLQEVEDDPDPRFVPGQRKERGFMSLDLDGRCPLFRGLGDDATFFQSHYWHLLEVPSDFVLRAQSAWTPIQVIERLDASVFGVEFHPERFTTEHPAGGALLHNFFAVARG